MTRVGEVEDETLGLMDITALGMMVGTLDI